MTKRKCLISCSLRGCPNFCIDNWVVLLEPLNRVWGHLPYYCLGHIGCEVVEWKRNQGFGYFALKSMCEIAKRMEMSFVELVTDFDNVKAQRLIVKCNGRLIELFVKPKHLGKTLSIRYRIYF